MTRIIHMIDHMGLGGAQRIVADLTGSGFGDGVFVLRQKGKDEIALPKDIRKYKGGKSFFSVIAAIFNFNRIIQEEDVEIIHCHLPASFFVGLLLSLKNRGVKFIFHEHGWVLFGSFFYKSLLRLVSKKGVILACSEYVSSKIKKANNEIDVTAIPNFIDLDKFYPSGEKRKEFRQCKGYQESDILIGFAGRLVGEKGWYELIQAFNQIGSQKKVYLLIAGTGKDAKKIKRFLDQEKMENVHLLGYESDMLSFYNGIDIFVLPSLIEPFGLVQLEAQACGVPVIASNVGGIIETLDEKNAVMVGEGDIYSLADKMLELIQSPDMRTEFSKRGLENVKRFSLETYVQKLEKIYWRE